MCLVVCGVVAGFRCRFGVSVERDYIRQFTHVVVFRVTYTYPRHGGTPPLVGVFSTGSGGTSHRCCVLCLFVRCDHSSTLLPLAHLLNTPNTSSQPYSQQILSILMSTLPFNTITLSTSPQNYHHHILSSFYQHPHPRLHIASHP